MSFEVSVQQEEQREGQKTEDRTVSEVHWLLYSLQTEERTAGNTISLNMRVHKQHNSKTTAGALILIK